MAFAAGMGGVDVEKRLSIPQFRNKVGPYTLNLCKKKKEWDKKWTGWQCVKDSILNKY